jgi:hypothetical protein
MRNVVVREGKRISKRRLKRIKRMIKERTARRKAIIAADPEKAELERLARVEKYLQSKG